MSPASLRAALVDTDDDPDESLHRYGATWVLASARDGLFVSAPFEGVAKNVPLPPDTALWTDDYSPLLSVVRWRQEEEEEQKKEAVEAAGAQQ